MIPYTPDPSLVAFLNRFKFNLITVSVQPETSTASIQPGKFFTNLNRVRAFPLHIFLAEAVQLELQRAQVSGCAVYFLINEGNGVPKEPPSNLNCGRRENISTLKTLAIDTDEADSQELDRVLESLLLKPHLKVRTSRGKYHYYFLLINEPAQGEAVLKWKALQRKLASLVPKLDQSMADINQVLRLPTFKHLKSTPFDIAVTEESAHPEYDLTALYNRLNAQEFNELSFNPYEINSIASIAGTSSSVSTSVAKSTGIPLKQSHEKFNFPESPHSLTPGNRRTSITRYIEHLMENVLPLDAQIEDYFVMVDAYILKYCTPADAQAFLTGSRRQNLLSYFHDQRNYRQQKRRALQAAANMQQAEAKLKKSLPDDFYLTFPGDLGFLTREFHNYTPSTSLELCFAAALAVSGALKAETFRLKGTWPLVNGLIIAGSGAGKSTIKSIIERTLSTAGLAGKYPQLLNFQNTVQSLHTDLYAAGGVGTTLIDESGDYLQTITAKNAPGYATALKKYFKEATTGREQGTRLHPGSSLSFQVPPIEGGMLSVWMLIQPDKFTASLNLNDMADGFLPRFLVFNGESNIELTSILDSPIGAKSFEPSLDLRVYLESLTSLTQYSNDQTIQATLQAAEDEVTNGKKRVKVEVIRAAQREAIYRARSEARAFGAGRVDVRLDDDARAAISIYLKQRQEEALKLQKENPDTPALTIYIRIEEMLLRLLCNGAGYDSSNRSGGTGHRYGRVTRELAEAVIKLHAANFDRFLVDELASMSKSKEQHEHDNVIQAVKRACKKVGGPARYKDVHGCIGPKNRPHNLNAVLKELVHSGDVWSETRVHARYPSKTVTVYCCEIPENILG